MRRIVTTLSLIVALSLTACAPADQPGEEMAAEPDPTAVRAEIEGIRDQWVRGAEAGDAAAVAALYTEDARMLGARGPVMHGRQAIQEELTLDGLTSMQVTSEATEVGSDLATDWGTFTQTVRTPDGGEQIVRGRYLVVLEKQDDGSWKIVYHMGTESSATDDDGDTAGDGM